MCKGPEAAKNSAMWLKGSDQGKNNLKSGWRCMQGLNYTESERHSGDL